MDDLQKYAKGCGLGCLGLIVFNFAFVACIGLGLQYGTKENVSLFSFGSLAIALILLAAVCYMLYLISKSINLDGFIHSVQAVRAPYQKEADQLHDLYHKEVAPLKEKARNTFKQQTSTPVPYDVRKQLRDSITEGPMKKQFLIVRNNCQQKAELIDKQCIAAEQALCDEWLKKSNTQVNALQWGVRICSVIALVLLCAVFIFDIGASDYGKSADNAKEGWSAATITLPHLTDGERYVSNPDSVLTAKTETDINHIAGQMQDELGIESAVIAVRRVKDGDIFRFAQDIFDLYGIGKDDRGLVVVLAVDDRQARIHTGLALENDFTDIETARLQDQFLVPYMKQDMPNEGLYNLFNACYCYLAHKDMPVVSVPTTPIVTQEQYVSRRMLPLFIAIIIWGVFIWISWNYVRSKLGRIRPEGIKGGPWTYDSLLTPESWIRGRFYDSNSYSSDSSYSSYSSYSSDSHSSRSYSSSSSSSRSSRSSGYSGGRSGGGGSTSRW